MPMNYFVLIQVFVLLFLHLNLYPINCRRYLSPEMEVLGKVSSFGRIAITTPRKDSNSTIFQLYRFLKK